MRSRGHCNVSLRDGKQVHRDRVPFALSFASFAQDESVVHLCCCFHRSHRSIVASQLAAHYPGCTLVPGADEEPHGEGKAAWTMDLVLHRDLFPIKRHAQFEDALHRSVADPVLSIIRALPHPRYPELRADIVIDVQPAREQHIVRARRCLQRLTSPFFRRHDRLANIYIASTLSTRWVLRCFGFVLGRFANGNESVGSPHLELSSGRLHEREEDFQAASDKLGRLLFEARITLRVTGPRELRSQARQHLMTLAAPFGQFHSPRLASFQLCRSRRRRGFFLSAEELATLWHPPFTAGNDPPSLLSVESREIEAPPGVPTPHAHESLTILGLANIRSQWARFGILRNDRRRHLYLAGKTGMGKSTLPLQLLAEDIAAGHGCILIDPHGDAFTAAISSVPRHRTNDVVLFDATDTACPVAFNVLSLPYPRHLVVAGIIASFKKLWGDSWGPRMEDLLRNALLALLDTPDATLVTLLRFVRESEYRASITSKIADQSVRSFWQWFDKEMHAKARVEALSPIQNKVGAFVSNPILRNIVGQARSTIDLRRIMDDGKVLLCNLSKGSVGEDASNLLAREAIQARHYFKAINMYEHIGATEDLMALGQQLLEQGSFDDGVRAFSAVGQTAPRDLLQRCGEVLLEKGKQGNVLLLLRAMKVFTAVQARQELATVGDTFLDLHQWRHALEAYKESQLPLSKETCLRLGDQLLRAGEVEKARELFIQAQAASPREP